MNSEERDLISRFIARVGGGQTQLNARPVVLPPIDPEADRFIGENFARYPEARYRVTQLAVVQEAALAQAQNRIRTLELQLQQAQEQLAQQASSQKSGGFFSNIFGHANMSAQQRPASFAPPGWNGAPQQQAPMGYGQAAPQQFTRTGTGFLGSALTTAAGVAGGMLAADAIEGLFSGHHGHDSSGLMGGEAGGFMDSGNETIINNYYGDNAMGGDPFGGDGMTTDGFSSSDFNNNFDNISDNNAFGGDDFGSNFGDDDF